MNLNYKIIHGYLQDLFNFPRMIFLRYCEEEETSLRYLALRKDPNYKDELESIYYNLESYLTTIKNFYSFDQSFHYDLSFLLEVAFPIREHDDYDTYFNRIFEHDEKVIREKLIEVMLLSDESTNQLSTVSIEEKINRMINNQNQLIDFLKNLHINDDYRWQLLIILNQPQKAIEAFQTFIKTIKPRFDAYYELKKEMISLVKKNLTEVFEQGLDTFNALTNYMIPKAYFKQNLNVIYLSITAPYQLTIRQTKNDSYFIFGINMLKGFEFLKALREDELEERTRVFKILSDHTRYQVLKFIASGVSSTKAVAEKLNVSSATISYHINAFVTQGIIVLSSDKYRKYEVNYDYLQTIWHKSMKDLKNEGHTF